MVTMIMSLLVSRKILLNLMHLGYTVLTEENVKGPKKKLQMKERPGVKYEVSRWTPLIQDIAEVGRDGGGVTIKVGRGPHVCLCYIIIVCCC